MRAKKMIGVAGVVAVAGVSAVVATSTASAAQSDEFEHGFGLNIAATESAYAAEAPTKTAVAVFNRAGDAPEDFNLIPYAQEPGDQGKVGSCVAWATAHSGYGVLLHEQKITEPNGRMAPMFIYAQIAKGNDQGTYASVALPMEKEQGVDTRAHYTQGDFDFTTQPTQEEKDNAKKFKLSGFDKLPTTGEEAKKAIKDSISKGMPVPIGFKVRDSFRKLDKETASNYSYKGGSGSVIGGHEVTIVAYNPKGLVIENSWGTKWGDNGFFTVPWSFLDSGDMMEAHAMGKLVQQ